MKKILTIIWKDTILRFSSRAEWLFFLILPIAFTFILAGGTGAPVDSRIRLAVVNEAKSELSAELIAALQLSEAIRPDVMSLETSEDQFSQRQVSAILVIPPSFDLLQLERSPIELELRQQPNDMNAMVASQAVVAAVSRIGSALDIAAGSVSEAERIRPFESAEERQSYFVTSLTEAQVQMRAAPDRLTIAHGATEDQIEYDPRTNSSAGQLITWVFIPLIGISSLFAYERQTGTLRRVLVTPTRRATYLLGTILGQVVMALGQMLLLIGFGVLVMGVGWDRAPGALAIMLISSTLAAAALGTTLGTFVKTAGQANGLSIMLGMVMALLGGCWYPIELFPQFVRSAVKILPTSWAMQGMLNVVLRGQGLNGVLLESGVLLGFAALFFTIGIWRFRFE